MKKKRLLIGKLIIVPMMILSIGIPVLTESTLAVTKEDLPDSFQLIATKAKKIARVTGPTLKEETLPNPNQTHENYALRATDLGIIWDATTSSDKKKVMMAFGDSYDDGWGGFGGGGDREGWRGNLLAISEDTDLSDGLTFSSMITKEDNDKFAKEIIHSEHDTSGNGDFTAIPTAGITVGERHFVHYMQIRNWGAAGRWNINFSEIAYSDDEGQNWTKSGVKWGAKSKFGQADYVKENGYVYMFGTPSGRMDNAYLARVKEENVLDKEKYEYWDGEVWIADDENAAAPIIEAPVSELSVVYNSYYGKWIMLYLNEDRYAIVMRSSSSLTNGWSAETEIATGKEYPGLYGSYIHPWTNDGKDLYFVMSEWGPYNVVLMHSTLNIGKPMENLLSDPSFEGQGTDEISKPWVLENGKGGVDRDKGVSRNGSNNIYLRNTEGWNAITQTIEVEPDTKYKLTGFVRTSQNNDAGYFGVRDAQGKILKETKFTRCDDYTKLTIEFNSGTNQRLTVFTGMWANGDTWVQADAFMLIPIDSIPPVITLLGDEVIEIPKGGTFTDPGAKAEDNLDGDLSDKITVTGKVDTNIVGTHNLSYDVTDSDGNAAESVTRTVIVKGPDYTVSNVTFRGQNGEPIRVLPKKGMVISSADFRNNSSEERTMSLVFVLYNKKGEIENFSGVSKIIKSGETENFTGGLMMPGNNLGYYAEVFVADSLTGLKPISDVTKISQK